MKSEDQIQVTGRSCDDIGQSWVLAGNGVKEINRCRTQLWLIKAELTSISAFLQNIGPGAALGCDELYGTGETIHHICKRVERLHDRLGTAICREQGGVDQVKRRSESGLQ